VIALEDLNVNGMLKNRSLSKAISDCSWPEFVRQIEYKAKWYGRTVAKIDRFYPSSKMCSDCGYTNDKLTLADREWACPRCGVCHDRDLNASRNILKRGLEILQETVGMTGLAECLDIRPDDRQLIGSEIQSSEKMVG
jgi:putative transposase